MTTKRWRIEPVALKELHAIATRYGRVRRELAFAFLAAFETAYATARANPQIGTAEQIEGRAVRRVHLDHFPHAIVFADVPDAYVVIAIAHGRRRPVYWRSRMQILPGSAPRKRR
jgi:toxin ParE1/3/4